MWASKGTVNAAELVQEPILLREVGSGMRQFVEDYRLMVMVPLTRPTTSHCPVWLSIRRTRRPV